MATTEPKYFYLGEAPSKAKAGSFEKKNKENKSKDLLNPLFNFDKSFTEEFSKVTPLQLAEAVPYVKIEIVNLDGKVTRNLNVDFFQKQIDFSKIGKEVRNSDRPLMSLSSVDISTSEASGYLYYTHVNLRIKIHRKDDLTDSAVKSLLFPGSPLRLTYGWNTKTGDDFLGKSQQTLSMNVITYHITMDAMGEAELVVECCAFNDMLANVLIGDDGSSPTGTLSRNLKQLEAIIADLKAKQGAASEGSNNYELLKQKAETFEANEVIVRGKISNKFNENIKKIYELITDETEFGSKKTKKVITIPFHDIFFTLCNDTLKALTKNLPVKNFEVVYGNFNKNCGDFSGKCLADFPIDKARFLSYIHGCQNSGQKVISVQDLLNHLAREYLQNNNYLVGPSKENKEKELFNSPEIVINFINIGDTFTLFIIDAKSDLPITTNELKEFKKASAAEAEKKFKDANLATLSLGHANTFIKSITLSQESNAYMKAVFISRAAQASALNPRDPNAISDYMNSDPVNPLTLPLQGTATLIGHVAWIPIRAFYLSTGLFMVDGVYKIFKVAHTLTRDNFETRIDFRWH